VKWLDARQVLVVSEGETAVLVDWPRSQALIDKWLEPAPPDWIVITGYVAATADGVPTTLKRNGSDYSAAIFGALLNATAITIWTDVDGVLSADPRLVPEAVVLSDLSYQETTELAYFGAKVVHPHTMAPAIQKQIPIWIRNTFNPSFAGSQIHATSTSSAAVKGFATVDNICLLNLEGTGMMGVPGVAQRLFGSLRDVGVSVIMISQASSEHSICFAVPSAQALQAQQAVDQSFTLEIQHGLILPTAVTDHCSILAAVGDNMVSRPGISGKLMTALGQAGVNIRAIAQGSSERNISVVVSSSDAARALRAVHAGFFLSNSTLSIGLIGAGGIGKTLLSQLHQVRDQLREQHQLDLRVRAVADSKQMWLHEQALALDNWQSQSSPQPLNLEQLAKHVHAEHLPHAVLIDCTASEAVARHYTEWLDAGIHVITPNKKANTQPYEGYQLLNAAAHRGRGHYLYETTVGAGLPVINTLRELVRTGDRILEIEGVLSGTLSYIFNLLSDSRSFSKVVREAQMQGFTEPDPREDLSGLDFARKLVILARECGFAIELSDVQIEPLLPAELQGGSVTDFFKHLPSLDAHMQQLIQEANRHQQVLRYVGTIDERGHARVALRKLDFTHPFARLQGTDNIVAFRTSRYATQPLIVQGPGAGPAVTAAGVFADLLRLASSLGAAL
jgi:aspartokinase/homoserine dehydrogenase 1